MSTNNNIMSFVAAEAITEFAVVSMDSAGKIVITDAATDNKVVGVAQRACATGDAVEVLVHGITRMIASETIDETTPILSAATNGKLQPCEAADVTFYPIARLLPNINQTQVNANEQGFVYFFGPSSLNA
jgi:hypothetical protein